MRQHLITIAAWTIALSVVTWQRLLKPAIERAFPGLTDSLPGSHESHPLLSEPAAACLAPVGTGNTVRIHRSAPAAAKPKRRTAKAKPAALA